MTKKLLVLVFGLLLIALPLANSVHAQAAPAVTLSPATVSPDGNVHVAGTGFSAHTQLTVSVSFTTTGSGATQVITLPVTTDESGAFSTNLHVPIGTTPKTYTVHVTPSGSQTDLASAQLMVVAGISLTPAVEMTGAPSSVSVSGTGFGASEQVQISYTANLGGGGTAAEQTIVTTKSDGSFSNAQLPVPGNAAPGFDMVTAQGQTSHTNASAQLEIVQLALDPATVAPGGTTAVSGAGFMPNSNLAVYTTVNLTGGGTQQIVTPTTANGSGNVSTNLTVPQGAAAGSYTVHIGSSTNSPELAHAALTVSAPSAPATITLTPSSQEAGSNSSVAVHGTGFGANESVTASYTANLTGGGTGIAHATGTTDGNGAFDLALPVPASVAAGNYTVTATGANSHATASATLTVTNQSTIVVSPNPVRPGQSITVTGSNFVPNQAVTVSAVVPLSQGGSSNVTGVVTANNSGAFSTSLAIPDSAAPRSFTVTASQTSNGSTDSATANETVSALASHLTLSPTSTRAGQNVSVAGTGFSASEVVAVNYKANLTTGGTAIEQVSATTNAAGSFSATLPVPANVVAGNYTVTATGADSHASTSAQLSVTLQSTLTVSSTSIRPGQTITVTGRNFGPNGTVTVSAPVPLARGGSTTISTTGNTDGAGNFALTLVIPTGAGQGVVMFTAAEQQSSATYSATATTRIVATNPQISLSPTTIRPGQIVTVKGSGFSSHVQITLSTTFSLAAGGSKTITATARTDSAGAFSAQLSVPVGASTANTTIRAAGPNTSKTATLAVQALAIVVSVAPATAVPGSSVSVQGHGYPPNASVTFSVRVTLTNGTQTTLQGSATTDASGTFVKALAIPRQARSGSYQLTARIATTGQSNTATLAITHLTPSLVLSPASTSPGSQITIEGFGWAPGAHVTLTVDGQSLGQATSSSAGTFTTKVTVPSTLSGQSHTITGLSASGRKATATLAVSRQITTRYYFGSLYTGHTERLAMLNATSIRANVTLTYQRTSGAPIVKTFSIAPHSRYTRDVNLDLGPHISAAASVASDVPISAARVNYQGTDGAVSPGSLSPSTIWYFANGNTSHGYLEYLALQNPNSGPVQVQVRIQPTHSKAFTVVRNIAPTARLTLKLNRFVKDAIGVTVRSNGPIVANRTIKIHQGIDSKNGVTAPRVAWYFAAGPLNTTAHNWIGAINPSAQRTYVTVKAYDPNGALVGSTGGYLKPFGRVGYLMNKVAGRTDVAVVVRASSPIVAEQSTYAGNRHSAQTDSFGTPQAATSRAFPALNTLSVGGHRSSLDIFNPGTSAIPVVVQFMTPSGAVVQRTYQVNPLSHQHIDVGSVVPNAQVGAEITSSGYFVAMSRTFFNNGLGGTTSNGSHG